MDDINPRDRAVFASIGQQDAAASVYGHQLTDPAAAARANAIARQWGLPADVVEADPKPWEAQQRINEGRSLAQTTPQAAAWLSDPRNAAATNHDYPGLQRVAQALTPTDGGVSALPVSARGTFTEVTHKPTVGSWINGIYQSMVGGLEEVKAGGNQMLQDMGVGAPAARPGIPHLADDPDANRKAYESAEGRIALNAPTFQSKTARALYGGASGLATMVPGLALSVLTGNPGPLAAQMGLSSFLGGYGKYRTRGQGVGAALAGATLEGGINVATAYLPGGYVATAFGKRPLAEFTAGLLLRDVPSFQAQTHLLDAVDTAFTPDKTWQDYWSSRPDAAYSALVGALPMALLGAPSLAYRRYTTANEASANATFIDNLMGAAEQSKSRTSAPAEFQSFLDTHLNEGAHENVFVPAEAVTTLFQTDHGEPTPRTMANDPFWSKYEPAVKEAAALGGDVVIPTSEIATHLAGSSDWNALRDHVRFSADGMSMAEAREYRKAAPEELEKAAAEIAGRLDEVVPNIAVRKAVLDKLNALPYTDEQRSTLATLIASKLIRDTAGENAKRVEVGKDLIHPVDLLNAWNLRFEQGKQGTKARKAGGKTEGRLRTDSLSRTASWVIRNKKTGEVMMETFDRAKVDALNAAKYEAVPIGEHLGNLGAEQEQARAAPDAETMKAPSPEATRIAEGLPASEAELRAMVPEQARIPKAGEPRIIQQFATQREADQHFNENKLGQAKVERDDSLGRDWRYVIEPHEGGFAIFDHAAPDEFFQGEKRGNISIARDDHGMQTGAVIRAFEAANFSTAVHELGHFWLEDLRTRALRDDATPEEKADWEAVKGWFGELGHETDDKTPIATEAHEYWARGMERYVMEGRAPSEQLKAVFGKMAEWMRKLYRSVMSLDAPITPEIRDVMDRMFASDEEIAVAREEMRVRPLEGAEALMGESERAAYQKMGEEARGEAYDSLLERVMRNIRYRRTREYAEQKRGIKDEVTAQVDAMPVHQALRLLRNGVDGEPVKIPRQWVVDNYGEHFLDLLPKGINPITGEVGIDPEGLAERTGFRNADHMMQELAGYAEAKAKLKAEGDTRSPRQAMIDDEMKARIEADLPDPLLGLEQEARAAVANDKAGELLSMESRALARKTGKTPTPYQMAKEWARGHLLAQKTVDALTGTAVQRYVRAVTKEGKAAEEAMLAGDYETALAHKNRQIANAALLAEAKALKEKVETASRKLTRVARAKVMPSVDPGYLEQAHALLEQVRMTTESGPRLSKIQSFQRWYEAQIADGREPIVPADYAEMLGTKNWRELPAADLLELKDVVDQIIELGRLKKTLMDGKKRRDYEGAVAEMGDVAAANPVKRQRSSVYKDRSLTERVKAGVRSADAAMLKFEQLMNFMDNAQPNGPWQRMMMNPLAEAQAAKMRIIRPLRDSLQALIDEAPKETKAGWLREVDTPELLNWLVPETDANHGQPWRFSKDQVLAMALNWGNEGNRQRLLDGYKWNEQDVRAVFDRVLSAHDWKFVQGVLDTVDTMWPAIEALEKRVNGFAPEKVEASPIETPYGTLRGGYFPAVYDPEFSSNAERHATEKLTGGGFFNVSTRSSATKERVQNVERPLLLEMSVVTRHLNEVAHDITHREAVSQVRRLLTDDRVRTAIDTNMGPEYRKRAMDYLENVARPGAADSKQDKGLITFARALNKRITTAGLGFRLSTILQQPTAFTNTMAEVGARRYASSVAKFYANPKAAWEQVSNASEEMRERLHNIDANINDMYHAQAKNPLQLGPKKISEWAFRGIAWADLSITIPGWMAAFDKATTELKMPDDEAVHYADGVIRKTQGAGSAKDQAAIQRTIWMKAFNPFFSYWSAHYNQLRSIGHEARRVRNAEHVQNLVGRFALQAIIPMAIQGWFFGGPQQPNEGDLHYLIKAVGMGNLGAIPGMNAITSHFGFGYPYHVSPWSRFEESAEKIYKDVGKAEGGEEPKSWIKDAFDVASYSFAIPASQIGATLQGLHDYHEDKAHPESASDWVQLLEKGKIEQHR